MKLLIAGSRDFHSYETLQKEVLAFLKRHRKNKEPVEVISGHAIGADLLGEAFAKNFQLPLQVLPADWKTHGRAAGVERNERMAELATHAVIFWDQQSPGTRNMIENLRRRNIPTGVVHV